MTQFKQELSKNITDLIASLPQVQQSLEQILTDESQTRQQMWEAVRQLKNQSRQVRFPSPRQQALGDDLFERRNIELFEREDTIFRLSMLFSSSEPLSNTTVDPAEVSSVWEDRAWMAPSTSDKEAQWVEMVRWVDLARWEEPVRWADSEDSVDSAEDSVGLEEKADSKDRIPLRGTLSSADFKGSLQQ